MSKQKAKAAGRNGKPGRSTKAPDEPSRFHPHATSGKGESNAVYKIPASDGAATMSLADIVGQTAAAEIEGTGHIRFHAVGDTGNGPHSMQEVVAEAMIRDVDPANHAASPAFFFHLGDVIYGSGKEDLYADEFYRPYQSYPNKIIAIPGNHDGEEHQTVDKVSLQAFRDNFCSPAGRQPPAAAKFGFQMVHQPGVYWILKTQLLELVGLYSNAGETKGTLGDQTIGMDQLDWLEKTLQQISDDRKRGNRKALIFGTHHQPYGRGLQAKGHGHPGNQFMLSQLEEKWKATGIWPDLVLSGHAHKYERYMRTEVIGGKPKTIPFLVIGAGGHAVQQAAPNINTTVGNVTYAMGAPLKGTAPAAFSHYGYGYLTVTVTKNTIEALYTLVEEGHRQPLETVSVPL
jgi:predicted phosphodiesterase